MSVESEPRDQQLSTDPTDGEPSPAAAPGGVREADEPNASEETVYTGPRPDQPMSTVYRSSAAEAVDERESAQTTAAAAAEAPERDAPGWAASERDAEPRTPETTAATEPAAFDRETDVRTPDTAAAAEAEEPEAEAPETTAATEPEAFDRETDVRTPETAAAAEAEAQPDDQSEPQPAETAELAPGDVPVAPATSLLPSDAADGFAARWREVQFRFVDDPQSATAEAEALVNEATDALKAALSTHHEELAGWRSAQPSDTERLRVALRRYHDLLERMLKL